MESNATMLKAEAQLRFMLYTSPKRANVIPISGDIWADRKMALGNHYAPGTEHRFTALRGKCESTAYVVAMLPLVRRVAHPNQMGNTILHVTIYLALAEDWPNFTPVDQLTPAEIRQAMLCLEEN